MSQLTICNSTRKADEKFRCNFTRGEQRQLLPLEKRTFSLLRAGTLALLLFLPSCSLLSSLTKQHVHHLLLSRCLAPLQNNHLCKGLTPHFKPIVVLDLAAGNLLLPLLIYQQPLGHPGPGVRHLRPAHPLVPNHLVDRGQVLR